MNEKPEIEVYCTVDASALRETADGWVCTKCAKRLVDLDDPERLQAEVRQSRSDGPICGVVRKFLPPALVSSLALVGCSPEPPVDGPLLPGIYVMPGGKHSVDRRSYPEAEWAPAQIGVVVSPNTGALVDVSHLPAGGLALDPVFEMRDEKFFRVPTERE